MITGPTGQTGLPGDRFNTQSTSTIITPSSGSVSLTVGSGLAYIVGNSVVVISSVLSSNRFEGTVTSYNPTSGVLAIGSITNIQGSFAGSVVYNVNLDGIDGPTGNTGSTGSVGPTGATGIPGMQLHLHQVIQV